FLNEPPSLKAMTPHLPTGNFFGETVRQFHASGFSLSETHYLQMMFRRSSSLFQSAIPLLLCVTICAQTFGQGQTPGNFIAIPPQAVARYHIDFARYYF